MIPTAVLVEQMLNELMNKDLYNNRDQILHQIKENPHWPQTTLKLFFDHVLRFYPEISDEVQELIAKRFDKTIKTLKEQSTFVQPAHGKIQPSFVPKRSRDGDSDEEPLPKRNCRLEAASDTIISFPR